MLNPTKSDIPAILKINTEKIIRRTPKIHETIFWRAFSIAEASPRDNCIRIELSTRQYNETIPAMAIAKLTNQLTNPSTLNGIHPNAL